MISIPTPRKAPERWWRAGAMALGVAVAAAFLIDTSVDPDLWGHVLFGQLAGAVGWIPRFDPYSYLSHEWINHEWLAELVFAASFDALGPGGLVALKVGAGLGIFVLLLGHLVDRGVEALRAAVLMTLLFLPLMLGLGVVRPHLFTYLLVTVLLLVLERSQGTRGRSLLLLPPVIALWTNFHGGVLAGIGVIGLWGGTSVLRALHARIRSRPQPGPPHWGLWIVVGSASVGATLLNPYGIELVAFLFETATVPRPAITEWQPIVLRSRLGAMWLAGIVVTGWALLRAERRPSPEGLVVLFVMALLPLTAVRHLPLLSIGIAVIAAPAFADLWSRRAAESLPPRKGWLGAALSGLSVLVIGVAGATRDVDCIRMERPIFPARAAAWLQASDVRADLATHFNFGEYLIWHLSPRIRVGMDGRRETVYPDSVYDSYKDLQAAKGEWDRFLEMGDPELTLQFTDSPADHLLELDARWESVYRDSLVHLYARSGSGLKERLAATPVPDELPIDGTGLCFP